MARFLTEEDKVSRLLDCLDKIRSGMAVKQAQMSSKFPSSGLTILAQEGFIKKTGTTSSTKYLVPESFSPESIQLMTGEIWKPSGKGSSIPKVSRVKIEVFSGEAPRFLPQSLLEDLSHDFAKIANKLGIQFSGKTPPGMAQHAVQLEMENRELRKIILGLEAQLETANKKLSSVGKKLRAEAENFEKKFGGDTGVDISTHN
jgi:hypothetical protein